VIQTPRNTSETLNHQFETWQRVMGLCDGWKDAARHDYVLWVLHNGFSYSHRNWPMFSRNVVQVNNRSQVERYFLGLTESSKRGTTFAELAIKHLVPQLLSIPIMSSTGEVGRLLKRSEEKFKFVKQHNIESLVLEHAVNSGILMAESQLDPTLKKSSLSKIQLASFVQKFRN
jgi:hypothetical protein